MTRCLLPGDLTGVSFAGVTAVWLPAAGSALEDGSAAVSCRVQCAGLWPIGLRTALARWAPCAQGACLPSCLGQHPHLHGLGRC